MQKKRVSGRQRNNNDPGKQQLTFSLEKGCREFSDDRAATQASVGDSKTT